MQNANIVEFNTVYCAQFIELSCSISSYGAKIGKQIKPYTDSSLPFFNKLNLEAKLNVLNALKTYEQICSDTIKEGYDLDSLSLIWYALRRLKLRPPSDLFKNLKKEHVIEIHDLTGLQIFRNFNFYDFCSYSLEELYCSPWSYLFQHEAGALEMILDFVKGVAVGKIDNVVDLESSPHEAKELYSENKNHVRTTFEYGSPLFGEDSRPSATLVAEDMKLVLNSN